MDPRLDLALTPARPGRLLRWTGFVPGVRSTGAQIEPWADHWRRRARSALAGDAPVLVAVGDSLAQGIGASHPDRGYVGLIARELAAGPGDVPIVNLSRSGARLADVLGTQLPALAAVEQPVALVVCTVGSNDLVRSARLGRSRRRVAQLLQSLPNPSVMATVPARGSMAATMLNRTIRAEAGRLGVPVADVGAALDSWRGRRAGDRFHPNDEGYRVWLEAFRPHLGCGRPAAPDRGPGETPVTAGGPGWPLTRP